MLGKGTKCRLVAFASHSGILPRCLRAAAFQRLLALWRLCVRCLLAGVSSVVTRHRAKPLGWRFGGFCVSVRLAFAVVAVAFLLLCRSRAAAQTFWLCFGGACEQIVPLRLGSRGVCYCHFVCRTLACPLRTSTSTTGWSSSAGAGDPSAQPMMINGAKETPHTHVSCCGLGGWIELSYHLRRNKFIYVGSRDRHATWRLADQTFSTGC